MVFRYVFLSFALVAWLRAAEHGLGHASPQDVTGPDLKVEVFADRSLVKNLTAICFDDQGRLYACESHRWRNGIEDNRDHLYWVMDDLASQTVADRRKLIEKWSASLGADYFTKHEDRVLRLEDTNGDGKADKSVVFADGFRDSVDGPAIGLLAGFGKIYLTDVPKLWALEDRDGDGKADVKTALHDGFGPRFSLSGHDLHGLAWGPDGKLYFSMGDRGYHLTTKEGKILANPGAGAVFRCDHDGANLEIFHYGLRNPQELAFNEFGDLFTVDNNCDQGDSARVVYVIEGGDAGWHMGHQALTTFKDQVEDGKMGQVPHWLSEGLWKKRHSNQPEWILPPLEHLTNGPSGLVFDSGTSLGRRYKNHFLVCDYKGASNQCFLYSFQVQQQGAGYQVNNAHVFHRGVTAADVDVGYDGKIYLADFGGGWLRPDRGNIIALHDPAHIGHTVVAETQRLFAQGFGQLAVDRLGALLSHADMRVRLRAQFELAAKGADGRTVFAALAQDKQADFTARLHAVWGLRQLGDGAALVGLLGQGSPELRAQAARCLGDLRHAEAGEALTSLLANANPRVRCFSAIALGKLGRKEALPNVLAMLRENQDEDVHLRHAGVMALQGAADDVELAKLANDASRSVRLAALLALRRGHSPRVAEFLNDADQRIAYEAIRAINDLPIADAYGRVEEYCTRLLVEAQNGSGRLPNEPIFRRLINISFRAGTPEAARRLMHFGASAALPENFRVLALRALALWPTPPPIDPTLGEYRPLPPRDPLVLAGAITGPLRETLEAEQNGVVLAEAVRLASAIQFPIQPKLMRRWLLDPRHPVNLRLTVLEKFRGQLPVGFDNELEGLFQDNTPPIRVAAAKTLLLIDPKEAERMANMLMRSGNHVEHRGAYDILAESKEPACLAMMERELEKLAEGQLDPALALDLYEACQKRPEDSLKKALAALDERLAKLGKDTSIYAITGGDATRGREVFANQGSCLKCHAVDGKGGDAGPKLDGVAARLKPEKLLESMINPNAEIVTEYGNATLTLRDGSSITGAPIAEDAETVTIKTAFLEPEKVRKTDIVERTPTTSAMPPMGLALPKADLRDLMAYLRTLTQAD